MNDTRPNLQQILDDIKKQQNAANFIKFFNTSLKLARQICVKGYSGAHVSNTEKEFVNDIQEFADSFNKELEKN